MIELGPQASPRFELCHLLANMGFTHRTFFVALPPVNIPGTLQRWQQEHQVIEFIREVDQALPQNETYLTFCWTSAHQRCDWCVDKIGFIGLAGRKPRKHEIGFFSAVTFNPGCPPACETGARKWSRFSVQEMVTFFYPSLSFHIKWSRLSARYRVVIFNPDFSAKKQNQRYK